MKMVYDGQLLTTTITLCYRGKTLQLSDIINSALFSHPIPGLAEEGSSVT